MVQSSTGKLFKVDADSGNSREIELNRPVTNGDGLLLRGRTLYVVRNQDEQIDVVKLRRPALGPRGGHDPQSLVRRADHDRSLQALPLRGQRPLPAKR